MKAMLFGVLCLGTIFLVAGINPTGQGYVALETDLNVNSTASATVAVPIYGHKGISIQGSVLTGTWTTSGTVILESSNNGSSWTALSTGGTALVGPGFVDNLTSQMLFVRARTASVQGTTAVGRIKIVAK